MIEEANDQDNINNADTDYQIKHLQKVMESIDTTILEISNTAEALKRIWKLMVMMNIIPDRKRNIRRKEKLSDNKMLKINIEASIHRQKCCWHDQDDGDSAKDIESYKIESCQLPKQFIDKNERYRNKMFGFLKINSKSIRKSLKEVEKDAVVEKKKK